MTIIRRVRAVLLAAGEEKLADELEAKLRNIRDLTDKLNELNTKFREIAINTVNEQMRKCKHRRWVLPMAQPDTFDAITCVDCGHTVCDKRAYNFGWDVKEGGGRTLYSHGQGQFSLPHAIRTHLGDKLIVKEVVSE